MDLDQKSERVLNLVTQIMSSLLIKDESNIIETPSFIVNHFILNSTNLPSELNIQNGKFKLPSFCDLDFNNLDCLNSNIVTLKVICKTILKFCLIYNCTFSRFLQYQCQ